MYREMYATAKEQKANGTWKPPEESDSPKRYRDS
jgi:hypothetical protein